MAGHTSKIVPAFDFSEAESLPLMERFKQCIARAAEHVAMSGYQEFCDFPCIPAGATEAELLDVEKRTIGQALPGEYRQFLTLCRYLKIDDGRKWADSIMKVHTWRKSLGYPISTARGWSTWCLRTTGALQTVTN